MSDFSGPPRIDQWMTKNMFVTLAKCPIFVPFSILFLAASATLFAQSEPIPLREGLLLPRVARGRREPLPSDLYLPKLLAEPGRIASQGESVARPDGSSATWESVEADENGEFDARAIAGGYLQFTVDLPEPSVWLLDAQGHGSAIINGRRRTGNPYRSWYQMPISLRAGQNQILIRPARGFRGQLVPMKKRAKIGVGEATVPDWLIGTTQPLWAAVPILNCQHTDADDWTLVSKIQGAPSQSISCGRLHAASISKTPFQILAPAHVETSTLQVRLELFQGDVLLDQADLNIDVREPSETHRVTFRSRIDNSVQYFGVVPPATDEGAAQQPPAMVLSLHGASVEGIGQARVYARRPNAFVVAPTNRRPFGFDWEDWGRIDALEVLDLAQMRYGTDPLRTYLTGHSMGGHGTWNIAANLPDRFAAIGPSAGWISFRSYAAARRSQPTSTGDADSFRAHVADIFQRSVGTSDTLKLSRNYATHGIYMLHGDADNNVPVTEARTMRSHLAEWHPDFAYFEKAGAGHWWGNQCCDWKPMFAFFDFHERLPMNRVDAIDFATANPGVSSRYAWAAVHSQHFPGRLSRIELRLDRDNRNLKGTSQNVQILKLDLAGADVDEAVQLELDETVMQIDGDQVWLRRSDQGAWNVMELPDPAGRSPQRYGLFKSVFDRNVVLVYGTDGTPEESAWARNKALYDAEQFWYRGNGQLDVVADRDFDPATDVNRNVVLYGHAGINRAWKEMLPACPLHVKSGEVSVGTRTWKSAGLAVLAIYPRVGSKTASVGIVAGTDAVGARITDVLPYFVSGVGYPDFAVFDEASLSKDERGVVAAGFWNEDWKWGADAVFRTPLEGE